MANIKRANTSGITKSGVAISDVPDAPTIGTVTRTNQTTVSVPFTAAVRGGAPTSYSVVATPTVGDISTDAGTTSPKTVTGTFVINTAYTFQIRGVNSTASGPLSSASNSVTPGLTAFESIASTTLSSDGTVTFSGIPGTFQHLQIRGIARDTVQTSGYQDISIQINGITSTTYHTHRFTGTGTAAEGGGSTSRNDILSGPGMPKDGNTADVFGAFIIDFHDYTSTSKNKTVTIFSGYDVNGSGYLSLASGTRASSTSAITSIELSMSPAGSNFRAGSVFSLYGIRG